MEFLAIALRARCRFAPSCDSVFWCSDLSSLSLVLHDARWSVEIGVLNVTRFAHRQRLGRELSLRDDSFVAVST